MNDTKQTNKAPAFSVIMPTYNRAFCIKTAIDSLLKQTYQQFELIIVDDGSIDRTEQLIQKFYQKYLKSGKFKYIKLKHVGVSAARNVGIKEAKNEWITYLDTDNYLLSNALGVYSYNISKNPKQQNFYGKFIAKTTKEVFGKLFNFEDIKKQNTIDLGVYLHTKQLVEKCGAFDETLKRFVDWEMIARHCAYSHPIMINEIVMEYNDSTKIKRITTSEKYSDTYAKAYEKIRKLVKRTFKEKTTVEIQEKTESCFFKIIVPNYNNMPYIQKCLDSILNQTFQDFKIIIVDDLSTDNSDKFCEMYSRKYPSKIIYQQVKQKSYAGICRNIGIDYPIKAKYIWAIDGDDYICERNALEILHNIAKKNNYDAIFFDGYQDIYDKFYPIPIKKQIDLTTIAGCDPTCHWLKIAKVECFGKYLEHCMVGQDLYHSYVTLSKIKTFTNISNKLYVYRYNQLSMSNDTDNQNMRKLREQHRIFLRNSLYTLSKTINNKNISENIKQRIAMIDQRIKIEATRLSINRKIVIAMSSFPARKDGMLNVIKILLPQCDKMCLWLNDYDKIPDELKQFDKKKLEVKLAKEYSCLKENGRYTWINKYREWYYLTVDDDINYPPNYVKKIIQNIDKYDQKAIVAYHGTRFINGKEVYYPFQRNVPKNIQVHRVGGGVMGFVPSQIGFQCPGIGELSTWDGDASISVWATLNRIKKYVIAHNQTFLTEQIDKTNRNISHVNALCLNRKTREKRNKIYQLITSWETCND